MKKWKIGVLTGVIHLLVTVGLGLLSVMALIDDGTQATAQTEKRKEGMSALLWVWSPATMLASKAIPDQQRKKGMGVPLLFITTSAIAMSSLVGFITYKLNQRSYLPNQESP